MHTAENRGVSYISKRTGTNKSACRKFLIRAGVYKVGGRTCVRSDAGTRWDWSIEWKGAKRWDDCGHWGVISKQCPDCKNEKLIEDFYSCNCAYCKPCHNLRTAKRKAENPHKVKEQIRKWREKNKDRINAENRIYQNARNAEIRKLRNRSLGLPDDFKFVPSLTQSNHSKRARRLRKAFGQWIRTAKDHHYNYLCGCTRGFLMKWIDKKFEKGMSWKDRSTWQIDHIVPVATFDLSTRDGRAKCFHYTNLQPLWNDDNHSKGSKIITCQPELAISIRC